MKKRYLMFVFILLAGAVLFGNGTAFAVETAAETAPVLTNGKPVTEENVLELLRQIEKEWPQDTVWGDIRHAGDPQK